MTPRDIVAIMLASSVLANPLATVVTLAIWGRPLGEIGGQTLDAIQVATLAVLAGYLAARDDG